MHPYDRASRIVLPIGACAILLTILAVGWVAEPGRFVVGYAPEQPIAFSHKLHAGDNKIPCLYCHTGATRSRHAGVPAVQTCMNCHAVTRTDRPAIQEITSIYRENKAIEWKRVYLLPDHVYFDHRPHVNSGIACQTCHGEVQAMARVSQVMSLRMGNCLKCHRDPKDALPPDSRISKGPEYCTACHR